MKKKIPLFIKFDTYVPNDVIDSLYRILETYKQNYSQNIKIVLNNFSTVIEVHDLQYPKSNTISVRMIEELKLANTWLFENDDVAKVKDFISQHFSSAFQFRIDILAANSKLGWHDNHPYPRVFIPMHHNLCTFNIREDNVIIGNQYQLNEMWMWDVRKWHSVDNSLSKIPRIMAAFSIDPDTETKINFDNYTNK